MECTPIIKLMHKYLDKDITSEEKEQLSKHVMLCERCENHFEQLKQIDTELSTLEHMEAPKHFTSDVLAQLPKEKKQTQLKNWFQLHPVLTAASIFIILMVGSIFSTWNKGGDFSVTAQQQLEVNENVVIIPKGKTIQGDIIVKNGDIKIEGKVQGDVTVINGDKYLASAGDVTGELKVVDQAFEWIWFNIKSIIHNVFTKDSEKNNSLPQ